ncbi:MaoC family dehydratase [Microbacterium sp. RD1]|uniref:MaoC family dehydratase n=1 Tax=Microbacterium sp. RD1 TaxID=3457313 RepID=UPI003FA60AED
MSAVSIAVGDATDWTFGPVTRTDIVRYQGASGDFNAIHHDDEAARAVGYDTAFAPGMFHAGLLATFATRWLGAAALRRFAVRFREPVWPGDILGFSGTVTNVDPQDDGEVVTVDLVCRRPSGAPAATGVAVFHRQGPRGGGQ